MNNPKSLTPILTQSLQFHITDACILRFSTPTLSTPTSSSLLLVSSSSLLRRVFLLAPRFFSSPCFARVPAFDLQPNLFRFIREEINHRKLHWEHEGDRGDAAILEGEGTEFDDRDCEHGLYQHSSGKTGEERCEIQVSVQKQES
ncbi:uncharacterized protein [Arachis hypogaea]|uniref:uncharacterized protein isoform X1 n=1 Tax=Arachis hypogaea TaxID=3818 RepID=UPI003B20E93A|nr:uncharacterized protein DS421_13g439210 [Arachis hypogaea]